MKFIISGLSCIAFAIYPLMAKDQEKAADPVKEAVAAARAYKDPQGAMVKKDATSQFNRVVQAMDALATLGQEAQVRQLIDIIDSKYPPAVRGAAMRALGSITSEEGIKVLQKEVRGGKSEAGVLHSLMSLGRPECDPFLPYLNSKDTIVLRAALQGLARCGSLPDAVVAKINARVNECTHDQGALWACCAALGGSRNRNAVDGLMKAKDMTGGYTDAICGLIRLTGKTDVDWNTWVAANKATFNPVNDEAKAKAYREKQQAADNFYGMRVEGGRLCFLLDGSQSMGGAPIQELKTQATRMLSGLESYVEYALVFFPLQSYPEHNLQPSQDGNQEALEFVDKLQLKLGTPIGYAALHAFKEHMKNGKYPVDCIYLLTDGAPTDLREDNELRCCLLGLFPGKCVRIHTVMIGGDANAKTILSGIAEDHGGQTNAGKGGKAKKNP